MPENLMYMILVFSSMLSILGFCSMLTNYILFDNNREDLLAGLICFLFGAAIVLFITL